MDSSKRSFKRTQRRIISSTLLGLLLVSTSSVRAFADAPPGAYLETTSSSQKSSSKNKSRNSPASSSIAPTSSAPEAGDNKYGRPLGESLGTENSGGAWQGNQGAAPQNSYAPVNQQQPNNYQGQAPQDPMVNQSWVQQNSQTGWQQPQDQPPKSQAQTQQAPYAGYAQSNNYGPPPQSSYAPPPQNMAAPAAPPAGGWQADYPSLGDMNGAGMQPAQPPQYNANVQYGQPLGQQPAMPAWGGSQSPPPAPAPPPPVATTKPAKTDDPDDSTGKVVSAIANTVLPIATSVVTNAIMNKMMYGQMNPGYGGYGGYPSYGGMGGYGNPYGGIRNPMGGYGYGGRPSLLNGIMGGGGNPLNMRF